MSCNCKKPNTNNPSTNNNNTKKQETVNYLSKVIVFLFFLVLLPILNLYIIWILFKMIVLNKNVDIIKFLKIINEKLKERKEDDDEDDDFDDLTEDDVISLDVEDITNINNQTNV